MATSKNTTKPHKRQRTRTAYCRHQSGIYVKQSGSSLQIGSRIGWLTIMGWQFRLKARARVVCECRCGTRLVVDVCNLASGHSTSCGCQRPVLASRALRQHGLTHTSTYNRWVNMRSRCNNPTSDSYALYGGRGITVCEEWDRSFIAFLRDMGGECPDGMTLERKDSNGNYGPDNCIWASHQDQANNRRNNRLFKWQGQQMTLRHICNETGANYELVRRRLKRHWPLLEAVCRPSMAGQTWSRNKKPMEDIDGCEI